MKTESQQMLASARAGNFTALLAVSDYWQETHGHEKHVAEWETLMRGVRYSLSDRWRKHRMSRAESVRRWFRDFAIKINMIEKAWRMPKRLYLRNPQNPYNEWLSEMANALIAWERNNQRMVARLETADA